MDTAAAAGAVAAARVAVDQAVAALAAAGARDEALAEFEAERRRLGIRRAPRMVPVGRVWRLGALLLGPSAELYGTGRVVIAEQPAHRSVIAASIGEHRAFQAAAVRGGYRVGETVDFDAVPIDLGALAETGESGPLVLHDGAVMVRWSPTQPGMLAELTAYLADRVELLVNPPDGA